MSLIVAVCVPTGIAISADSRTTMTMTGPPQEENENPSVKVTTQTNVVLSDSADKLFIVFGRFGVGAVGDAIVNNLPIAHYVEKFQAQFAGKPSPTNTYDLAKNLLEYFRSLQPIPNTPLGVFGYDSDTPFVLIVDVLKNSTERMNFDPTTRQVKYGPIYGGDNAIVNRLLSQPEFNPPFDLMNLQDAVDFSRHLIRVTIDQMRFEPRFPTLGGPIDTLIVTRNDTRFLKRKSLTISE